MFHVGSLFLSSLVSTTLLSCVSMNNQVCKVKLEIINVNSNEPIFFILLVLNQVGVVVAVIILTVRMPKYVFLML